MNNFLNTIIPLKKQELLEKMKINPLQKVKEHALTQIVDNLFISDIAKNKNALSFITEIKLASPTIMHLGNQARLTDIAKEYEMLGADAISIITEQHFFKGTTKYIPQVKRSTKLPILQKDFVIDEYQIYEAKSLGSDAILLVADLVSAETLLQFVDVCNTIHIEPVVEVYNEEGVVKALQTDASIIAVNARNLRTLTVSVDHACAVLKMLPESKIRLGFSGISTVNEVTKYYKAGAAGVLIGTSLMKAENKLQYFKSLQLYEKN